MMRSLAHLGPAEQAMSENAHLVQSIYAAFERGENGSLQLARGAVDLGWAAPDVEWDASRAADLVPDLAVLIRNQRQSGRHSGIVTGMPAHGWVFTLSGGRVVRVRIFPNQAEALGAMGAR
jgi:ketosteroid isomerase-like protein